MILSSSKRATDYRKGFLCMLLSTTMYGLMPTISMLGYQVGLNTFSIMFGRCALSIIIYVLIAGARHLRLIVSKKQFGWIMLMSVCGMINGVCVYESYKYLPAGIASLMAMMYVVFIILIEITVKLATPDKNKFLILAMAFVGMVIILWSPDEANAISSYGVFLGLLGSLIFSFSVVMINHKLVKNLPLETIFFYEMMPSLIVIPLFAICLGLSPFPVGLAQWGSCAALAFLNSYLAMVAFFTAVRLIGAGNAAMIGTFEPFVSSIAGAVVLGDVLPGRSIVGGFVIMVSILIHNYIEKKKQGEGEKQI